MKKYCRFTKKNLYNFKQFQNLFYPFEIECRVKGQKACWILRSKEFGGNVPITREEARAHLKEIKKHEDK